MENSELPKLVVESRIPKAPATAVATMAKSTKLQSPVETKLPMIKSTTKSSKLQITTTPSLTSNQTHSSNPPVLGTGTKLRRANSSLADSNLTKVNAATNEPKLRRVKSTLTETKRPKSQILMSGTKLPKLQPNTNETKPSKIGSVKLPQLESANATTREIKGRKIPNMTTPDSKLPRIQPLNLPLKQINSDVAEVEPRRNSRNIEALNLSAVLTGEPIETQAASLSAKISKTTNIDTSSKTSGGSDAKAAPSKTGTVGTAKKQPNKAHPVANTLPRSIKISPSNAETLSPTKSQNKTTGTERKLPKKATLTLTGLKTTKLPESKLPKTPTTPDVCKHPVSKLPKTPTTPDDSKLPRLPGTGVTVNSTETRRQKPTIRR